MGLWKRPASIPSKVEVIRTTNPATAEEYQGNCAKGEFGRPTAQATYANVPAVISHLGQYRSCKGNCFLSLTNFVAKVIQTAKGVKNKKIQNAIQWPMFGVSAVPATHGSAATRAT